MLLTKHTITVITCWNIELFNNNSRFCNFKKNISLTAS